MIQFGALVMPFGAAEQPFRDVIAASVADDPCEDLGEVMDEIASGDAVAWIASEGDTIRGAVVTQVLEGRKGRQCFIRHCAGVALHEWLSFMPVIEAWARFERCTTVRWIGRAGWERKMAPLGYAREGVVMGKTL